MKLITWTLFVLFLFTSCGSEKNAIKEKPNILFFLVDDQRNDMLSCAGHPFLQTPTIDKLAENGIRFTNAFVTTSICAASRASILTGLYESKHNYTFIKDPIKEALMEESYPYILKDSGYETGFIGKFGVKLEQQDSLLLDMFDYYKPSPKSGPHFIEMEDGSRRHSAEIKGDEAISFINNRSNEKPFCLSISFNAVHAVDGNKTPGNEGHYPYPKAVENLYSDIEMPEPNLNDPGIFNNHPEFLKNSLNRERYFWRWDTPEKYQTNMRAYFRMISGYDNVINRVIEKLKENGLDENTVIIFSSDNGYYMGNRGFAGKWSHYEESLRVPLIIYDPRVPEKEKNTTSDRMVLNIDIPATILDLAGIQAPENYQGLSLTPLVNEEEIVDWRNEFLCEHRMEHIQIPKFVGIRNQRYVYANYYEQEPPYEYLHDLEKDPKQLENLIDHKDYAEILERMRMKCDSLENQIKSN